MMRPFFYRFVAAIGFLTAIPVGYSNAEFLGGSVIFFPIVGLILGGLLWLQSMLLGSLLHPSLNALGLVFTGVILTRGLHLDGLADSADGLLSHQSPERMLAIMRDSRIGTMGALALIFDVLLRWQCLAHCSHALIAQALVVPPVLGRMVMAMGISVFPYARDNGMATEFIRDLGGRNLIGLLLIGAATAVTFCALQGLILWVVALAVCFLLFGAMKRKFGGYTGDILGAANELTEIVSLVILVAVR